jgi:hypothetical protein
MKTWPSRTTTTGQAKLPNPPPNNLPQSQTKKSQSQNTMNKTILATMTLTAGIAFNPASTLAHEGHDHGTAQPPAPKVEEKPRVPADSHGHSHATKIPGTVEEIWNEIHKQQAQLVRLVEEKKLSSAHDPAFIIRDPKKARKKSPSWPQTLTSPAPPERRKRPKRTRRKWERPSPHSKPSSNRAKLKSSRSKQGWNTVTPLLRQTRCQTLNRWN